MNPVRTDATEAAMTTTPTLPTVRFKNDGPMRKRLFVSDAMAHPAKGHIAMWQEMVERYSNPGDTVLDPMAGIGTSLVAALMGRNVICVELEAHFVDPMRRSWEKMRQMPMLGCAMGTATIIQGDARRLPIEWGYPPEDPAVSGPDVILTSPPYEQALKGGGIAEKGHTADPGLANRAYSRNVYERLKGKVERGEYKGQRPDAWTSPTNIAAQGYLDGYSTIGDNIGNLRNAAYWDAMRQVYSECYRVLRPGGIMALVLKGFTRDGKYVDLPGQTEALLLEAGWQKHDHWRRELWNLSFWRILEATDKVETVIAHCQGLFDLDIQEIKAMKRVSNGKLDDRLNYEEVLAFRKPAGDGKGVDTVITSPPYEGVADSTKNTNTNDAARGFPTKPMAYTRPSVIITSPPYEGSAVADLNASPLNGPIGDASRRKDRRKGGQEQLDKFGSGYSRKLP